MLGKFVKIIGQKKWRKTKGSHNTSAPTVFPGLCGWGVKTDFKNCVLQEKSKEFSKITNNLHSFSFLKMYII
jgi:hypothetical protein